MMPHPPSSGSPHANAVENEIGVVDSTDLAQSGGRPDRRSPRLRWRVSPERSANAGEMNSPSMTVRGRRLPGLDGLRALAIMAVVAYHLDIHAVSGGYLGVDLFFVLSGFLITSLLVEEQLATSRIALLSFWGRHAKRLLPALFTMLIVVIIFTAAVDRQNVMTSISTLRGDALSTIFYVANWHQIVAKQSYFAVFGAPSPFQHTWSLAIEEQFYLVFPFVAVALAANFNPRRRRISWVTLLVLAVASSVEMALLFHPGGDPTRVYYGTDTRAFDLLIGAALAFSTAGPKSISEWTGRALQIAVWPAAVLLGWFWVTSGTATEMPKDFMYRGGFFLCSLLAALVVATAAMRPDSWFTRVLSYRPLVAIGLISYGIYVWHWPIIVLINPNLGGSRWRLDLFQVVLIAIVSLASYFLDRAATAAAQIFRTAKSVSSCLGRSSSRA